MKRQYIPILAITLLLGLFLISNVSASATLVNPASSASISGSYTWNATNGTTPAYAQIQNCTLWGKSVSTANSTYKNLAFASNDSAVAQLTMVNGTFATTGLEDSNDYTFYASCYNISSIQQNSSVNTAIVINNGVPTAPTLSPTTNSQITTAGTQTFTGTVVDSKTTSCTYVIGRGGTSADSLDTTSGSGVYSGSSCTFSKTFTSSSDNGNWNWIMTASDGTDTVSTAAILSVMIAGSGGGSSGSGISGSSGVNGTNWGLIIGIAIAIIVVIFLVKKK